MATIVTREVGGTAKNSPLTNAELDSNFINLNNEITNLASSKLDVAATSFGGNSATATKLQTARTLTIGKTGKSFDGSANVSWSLAEVVGIGVPEAAQELAGGVDLNTIQTPGFYVQSANVEAASGTNYPIGNAGALVVLKNATGVSQLYYAYGSASEAPRAFFRALYNGSWSSWREIYHSGNLAWNSLQGKPTAFPPSQHTHPVGEVTGLGTAATANVTTSALDSTAGRVLKVGDFGIGGSSAPTVSDIDDRTLKPGIYMFSPATSGAIPYSYGVLLVVSQASGDSNSTWANQVAFATDGRVWNRWSTNLGPWSPWREAYHSGNINTANAGTATKLQTARTLTIGKTGKSFDGSANVSWSLAEIGAARLGVLASGADLNTVVDAGFYRLETSSVNAPAVANWGQLIVARGGGNTILQIATGHSNGEIYWRQGSPPNIGGTGSWGPWHRFFHSGNLTGSMSGNGYQRLPGGLIIQWGRLGIGDIGTDYFSSVSFPIAFPNQIFQVNATLYSFNGAAFDASVAVTGHSLTGFNFTIQEWSSTGQTLNVAYIAIGY